MVGGRTSAVLGALVVLAACGGKSGGGSGGETFGYVSSPADGESGVATTRETILTFDMPLDGDSALDALSVAIADSGVDARVHIYKDKKRAALFYADHLPGDATVTVTVDGDMIRSESGLRLDADRDGEPGGVGTFSFDTISLRPVPDTDACGRVFASELDDRGLSLPLEGVRISVDGASDTMWALTGPDGRFCLEDTPAGRIFVHIDGTSATNTPANAYYPSVGKAWKTFGGERVSVGLIHLPAVASSALLPVSREQPTTIEFVDDQRAMVSDPLLRSTLDDVTLTVPADSLFADDGTRGGSVGIAPVAADRLPGLLPLGLEPPLVITVQTDGATNFDEPAPICFMNLPDPVTGVVDEPGDKTSLWGFNHDTGRFELAGSMTVTADGKSVCSDPGVGVLAPGWFTADSGTECNSQDRPDRILTPPRGTSPPPPPDEPSCDELEIDILAAGEAIGTCLSRVGGLGTVAGAIKNITKQLRSLSTARKNLESAFLLYGSGASDRGDIRLAMEGLRALKGALNQMIEVASDTASPLAKAINLLGCAQSTARVAKAACEDLTSRTGTCSRPPNDPIRRVCENLPELSDDLGLLKTFLEAANRQLKDVAFAAVCAALDRAQAVLEAGADDDDLLDALSDLNDSISDIPEADDDEDAALDTFWDQFVEVTDDSADAANAREEAGTTYIQVDMTGGARQRLTSTDSGYYRALLPSDIYYALSAYEPLTDRCGVNIGLSSSSGERTIFHGPQLGVCDPVDSDGDGLTDFAEGVVGTSIIDADTDGDGIEDRAELLAGTDPGGRSTILPGAVVEDDLAAPGEVDVWRLVISEPTRVYFQVLGIATDGGLLGFDWLAPDDSPMGSSSAAPGNPSSADQWFSELASGVYRLSIAPLAITDDGSYRFRVFLPTTDERPLIIGEPHEGAIQVPGDVDRWTFDGSVGDEIFFDMLELVARIDVLAIVELRSPTNALVFTSFGSADSFEFMDAGPFTLTETGMYTLIFGSEFLADEFIYRFTLGGLVSSGGGTITDGVTERGELAGAEESHEWTFSGSTGERVFLEFTSIEGSEGNLEIVLLAPDGTILADAFGAPFAPEIASRGPIELPQAGTYRIIIRSTAAGISYAFILHRPTVQTSALTLSAPMTGAIGVPGEVDEWTFFAGSGAALTLDVLSIVADDPVAYELELLAPDGSRVFVSRGISDVGEADFGPVALPATGTYRMQVRSAPNLARLFSYVFHVSL